MCDFDKCLYYKKFLNSIIILCLYLDDNLIFGSNVKENSKTKKNLSMNFDMKELGHANMILGTKISRTDRGATLS